jgi:hypothetical protein
MSAPLQNPDDDSTIDGSAMTIVNTDVPPAASNKCTSATPCRMSADPATDVTLFTGAARAMRRFDYSLTLTVPDTATGGEYTGGALTFTASN